MDTINEKHFIDRFENPRPRGKVIGQNGTHGMIRKGVDIEKTISIDNGALRIEPLLNDGWGRSGIAYGPYTRKSGLTFAVSVINGHNTSQAGSLNVTFKNRMVEWVKGSQAWSLPTRMAQWLRYGRKGRTLRMWRRWWETYRKEKNQLAVPLDENLALGWFPREVPQDPRTEGNTFIVHATGAENGELWVRAAGETPPMFRGLQNIPLYYIVILRDQGAAYYAAAVEDTAYLPAYPCMRPLAIDAFDDSPAVFAGLFQSVSGQIGFRADTRVREAQVTQIRALSTWYGTASAYDLLKGIGSLDGTCADSGHTWTVPTGTFLRTDRGCTPVNQDNAAILQTGTPPGLIHLLAQTEDEVFENFSLIWRYQDQQNYWVWEISSNSSQVKIVYQGETTVLAREEHLLPLDRPLHSVQIQDDGSRFQLYLDGRQVCAYQKADTRLQAGSGVGFAHLGASHCLYVHSLEVHPRTLPVPDGIHLTLPWRPAAQQIVVAQDDFAGQPGKLDGRALPVGNCRWQRDIGTGTIEITENGLASVSASRQKPNPGRTAYMIPWDNPANADLELAFMPPGTSPGEGEKSRIGIIFYQDDDNYITVSTYVDDYYDGSSFAFFYHLDGFEEIYDAIWSNVGRAIAWGKTSTARVVYEGGNFAVYINGEAVLYRSLTDVYPDVREFSVRRVGIVVNWEWGDDTGTKLKKFTAARNK